MEGYSFSYMWDNIRSDLFYLCKCLVPEGYWIYFHHHGVNYCNKCGTKHLAYSIGWLRWLWNCIYGHVLYEKRVCGDYLYVEEQGDTIPNRLPILNWPHFISLVGFGIAI